MDSEPTNDDKENASTLEIEINDCTSQTIEPITNFEWNDIADFLNDFTKSLESVSFEMNDEDSDIFKATAA